MKSALLPIIAACGLTALFANSSAFADNQLLMQKAPNDANIILASGSHNPSDSHDKTHAKDHLNPSGDKMNKTDAMDKMGEVDTMGKMDAMDKMDEVDTMNKMDAMDKMDEVDQ